MPLTISSERGAASLNDKGATAGEKLMQFTSGDYVLGGIMIASRDHILKFGLSVSWLKKYMSA